MKAREQFLRAYGIRLNRRKHAELLLLLLSLEVIVAFSYLGFISIPPISVTTLHILVIVAAMYFGPSGSASVALVFAVASMWKASVTSTEIGDLAFSPTLSGKPLESIVMAAGARVVFAWLTGLIFRLFFSKPRKYRRTGITVITILTTLLHSALVYVCMVLFFGAADADPGSEFSRTLVANNLLLYLLSVLAVLFFDFVMQSRRVKDFFDVTAVEGTAEEKNGAPSLLLVGLVVIFCTLIILHFLSRLQWYLRDSGGAPDPEWAHRVYSLLAQFVAGIAAVFAVLALFFRWNREYYSSLTIRADRKARESAESANRSKSDFLFNMSHDIRTPMNAIMGFTGIARKHIDDRDKVLDCLEKSQQSGNMLLSLINSVLEVSRIESGNAVLEEEPGDVYKSFSGIENTMRELAAAKDIALTFAFGEIRDRYVYADLNRMMRILVNVIGNAIKYTREGGTVRVECAQEGEVKDCTATYRYTVSDNGIGMSEEFQKHVFEQFARENNTTISGIQGTGLGMTVVKSFVDLMGGTVTVKSRQGEGTTFTILLPLRLREGAICAEPAGSMSGGASPEDRAETAGLTGSRVLLVDDNELNREIAAEILEEEGLLVEDADDGTKAIDLLRKTGPDHFDFILMDIQMPVMDGYEATKAIRTMYPDRHIPIIALSANAFAEDRAASAAAGMDGHIAKPINTTELFGMLSRLSDTAPGKDRRREGKHAGN